LSSYIGNGNVSFSVFSEASYLLGISTGNYNFDPTYSSDVSVTVTYDYAAAPIPGAVWLFGPGLVGLIGFKRKCLG
jgi:hypothetical protein